MRPTLLSYYSIFIANMVLSRDNYNAQKKKSDASAMFSLSKTDQGRLRTDHIVPSGPLAGAVQACPRGVLRTADAAGGAEEGEVGVARVDSGRRVDQGHVSVRQGRRS